MRRAWLFALSALLYLSSSGQVNISKVEYYLDADPGLGAGIEIPFTAGDNVTLDFNVPLSGVSSGIHMLSIRSQDAEQVWSQTNHQVFFVIENLAIPNLTRAEYFFDNDPGFGQGTPIALSLSDSVILTPNIDLSALIPGIHQLVIRLQDGYGNWSQSNIQTFFLIKSPAIPNLVAAEYFFDTDPGFGAGIAIDMVAADSLLLAPNFDLSDLTPGIHQVVVRAQNADGNWSQSNIQTFFLIGSQDIPDIVAAEYYFDTDPGFGAGNAIEVVASDSVLLAPNLDLSGLDPGIHQLNVRAKNAFNNWSQVNTVVFFAVVSDAIANVDYVEYYFGEDPGLGLGTSISVTAGDSISLTETIALSQFAVEDTVQFSIRARDSNGSWSTTSTQQVVVADPVDQVITFTLIPAKTYGDPTFTLEATSDAGLPVSFETSNDQVIAINGNEASVIGVGESTISAIQAGNIDFKVAEVVDQLLVVSKAELSVMADDQSRIYGLENPALTVSYDGFVNNEDQSVLEETPTVATIATSTSDAGAYAITPSGAKAANYNIKEVAGTLTVEKAPLTATAENANRLYGADNPSFSVLYEGFVNAEDATVLDAVPVFTTEALATSDVGFYPISLTSGMDNNYAITDNAGQLSITQAPLTASISDQSRSYGQENGDLTIDYLGFVNNEDFSVIDVPPTITTDAVASSDVGQYDLVLSGGSDNNYDITTTTEVAVLSVSQVDLLATADDQSRSYGEPNPSLSVTYEGFVLDDSEAVLDTPPTASTSADETSSVGSYDILLSVATDLNYNILPSNGILTVGKSSLAATANDQNKKYGEVTPTLTVAYTGFVNGDSEANLDNPPVASSSVDVNSNVGSYEILLSEGTDGNYSIISTKGTLLVSQLELSAKANDQNKTYGEDTPELTVAYAGFVNGDTETDLDNPPVASTQTDANSNAGEYDIVLSDGNDLNYAIAENTGKLTINKANLKITADDASMTEGEELPEFTLSFDGFVNNDSESDITLPNVSTTANSSSAAGTFPIELSNGNATNYVLTLVNGVLTIEEGVALGQQPDLAISVYPNPTIDKLRILDNGSPIRNIDIFNLNGQKVMSFNKVQDSYDVKSLPSGVYHLLIMAEEKTSLVKFIKY